MSKGKSIFAWRGGPQAGIKLNSLFAPPLLMSRERVNTGCKAAGVEGLPVARAELRSCGRFELTIDGFKLPVRTP